MLINIKYILLARKKALLLFSLLIFLGVFASCSLKATYEPPEETWAYPGGAGPPMSMVFHSGGSLTFVGGFDNYHPATWHIDEQINILQIKPDLNTPFPIFPVRNIQEKRTFQEKIKTHLKVIST